MPQIAPNTKLKLLGWGLNALGACVAVVIVTAAHFAVYGPIDDRADGSVRETDRLRAILRDEADVRAEHARVQRRLATARRQAMTLQARIPDEPQETEFLAQASQLAGQFGLKIDDYRPGAVTAGKAYSELQVDLICQGDYTSICRFLDQLSKLPRHSTIGRLQVDADHNRPENSVKISVTLYFVTEDPSDVQKGRGADA